jgi:hypothetical protein
MSSRIKAFFKPKIIGYVVMGVGLAVALALVTVAINRNAEALNQICFLTERDHEADVKELTETYAYIEAIPPEEQGSVLNQFIIRGLPAKEIEARTDAAPDYCDEEGRGIPEPDIELPPHKDYSGLLANAEDKGENESSAP